MTKFLKAVVIQIVNPLIYLLAAGAFVVFIWGVFVFIMNAGDETKRKEGRQAIFWGIIGLVIIFGAYGIINAVLGTFNLGPITPISR
ncbi:hypothetical protein KGM48_03805 [Patescibacteria group bacterium]|nr:hypothetical protein [Patescibacteria group bacterium]